MATATLEPESVIRHTFLFRAAVSRIAFGFIGDAAGYSVKKRKAIRRQQCGRRMKSLQKVGKATSAVFRLIRVKTE